MIDGGEPGGSRLLILSGTTVLNGNGDRRFAGASREHQLLWAEMRTDDHA
jgi:hypothetical protein